MINSETSLQMACVKWFRFAYPKELIFHIPNGGNRNVKEGAILKHMGVVAGVPDLMIPKFNLFIEMKTKNGTVSSSQNKIMRQLSEAHYDCYVVNSLTQFKKVVQSKHS